MSQKLTISGEALTPSLEAALEAELFLQDNYLFRRNVLNGKLEFATLPAEVPVYRTLTQEALNSIVIRAKREHICEGKPKGQLIDNEGEIDYEQLYAQVLHEIRELKVPYWFNNEEVKRIQELNLNYMEQKDIAEIVRTCFRKPGERENAQKLSSRQILQIIQAEYPSVKSDRSTKIHLGLAMKELGIEHLSYNNRPHYLVIPVKSA
jgi:hypothetical protein